MMNALHPVLSAAIGTGFTFLMTALGAAVVFFFRGEIKASFQQVFLGFAAGVMIAASVWSLLIPAIERAEEAGQLTRIGVSPISFLDATVNYMTEIYEATGDVYLSLIHI